MEPGRDGWESQNCHRLREWGFGVREPRFRMRRDGQQSAPYEHMESRSQGTSINNE